MLCLPSSGTDRSQGFRATVSGMDYTCKTPLGCIMSGNPGIQAPRQKLQKSKFLPYS